jgi:hypothetical protein
MKWNGAYRNLLNQTWKMQIFNAPEDVYISTEKDTDNSAFRKAFHDLTTRPEEYQEPKGGFVSTMSTVEKLQYRSGYLRNTVLVIDPICVESVLQRAHNPIVDDMRMLAFEADFPQEGRTYIEGYPGWMWVRMKRLIDNFYAERISEERGMDVLWKAAKGSRHHAFANLDAEEAKV